MGKAEKAPWFEGLVMAFLAVLTYELRSKYGFWTAILIVLALLAGVFTALAICFFLVSKVADMASKMTRVVLPGEPIPSFFGVSYTDAANKWRVCHVMPLNLLVGAVQACKLGLKRGLNVKVGPRNT